MNPTNPTTSVLYRDEHAYCAHPHAARTAAGDIVVVFNRAPRRNFVLHPPEDPYYQNVIIRSEDDGVTWSTPQAVPDFSSFGTECAGLTPLADGRLMLNQWRFDWYPLNLARRMKIQAELTFPSEFMSRWAVSPEHHATDVLASRFEEMAPWARGGGTTSVHFSDDGGRSFLESREIATAPFSGGYGMRGGITLPDGRILLPLSDVPNYRSVFLVESSDGGDTWSDPRGIWSGAGHEFEEPSLIRCRSGRLVIVLRDNETRLLHQSVSVDGGTTWSQAKQLPITGYPAQLLELESGALLMTYGVRDAPFGIHAIVSADEGDTWRIQDPVVIRGDLPNKNLGYPTTVPTRNGDLLTVYYGEDGTGTTAIQATNWNLPSA